MLCVTDFSVAEDTLVLTVYPEDYMTRLVDYCMLKIYALIRVKETNQMWSDEDDFVLEKPTLKVEVVLFILQPTVGRLPGGLTASSS